MPDVEERMRSIWEQHAAGLPGKPKFGIRPPWARDHGRWGCAVELLNGTTLGSTCPALPEDATDEQLHELAAKMVVNLSELIARQRIKDGAKA